MTRRRTWDERAQDVFAQGCNTYSVRSDQFVKGVYPTHCIGGEGPFINCVMPGNRKRRLFDLTCGLGSNILSINNRYSLPTTDEVALAEDIRKRVPICEKMRFLKTGSEACQAAVRIARAYVSERECWNLYVQGVGAGYHGWHNWCISAEKPGTGCVGEGYLKCDNIDEVIKVIDDAAVSRIGYCIVEPVQLDLSKRHIDNLKKLRKLCTKQKIVLIFDEVITGFRTPGYCMSNFLGVQPDIICLGKAMSNGYPLAVVGGKREIMDTPGWFVSSTFAGEHNTIKQARDVLKKLTPRVISELWQRGAWFKSEFNKISDNIQLVGIPTKAVWQCKSEGYKALFFQEMLAEDILVGKAWHITAAHTHGVMLMVLNCARRAIGRIERREVELRGDVPTELFKRY